MAASTNARHIDASYTVETLWRSIQTQKGKVAKVTVRIRRLQEGSGVVIDEDGPVVSD
ncbi:MAG: hypothetical protein NZ876_00565 [Dehalococcoidia bacterium]|uniref:Uncharacterized protein n=1 Tax=marine metagenome TaxID=408172 RepID=A0A381QNN1_9ZZZZ|nr:hypothetical protein [Dehalococcoidia bacterium]